MSDAADMVQLAAREIWAARADGAAEERARIVAMLRAEAGLTPRLSTRAVLFLFADRIERGDQ